MADQKSFFTHRHSRLVAASAAKLAGMSGFSKQDAEKMTVAGLLHDLGKLSVPGDAPRENRGNPPEHVG